MPRAGLDAEVVIDTAASVADAEGLRAVTVARLASTLGVRAPSLYAHIGGVDDVHRRIAARGRRELREALQGAAAGRARRDALHAIAAAWRAYAREHPGTYEAAQRSPAPGDPDADVAAALVEVVAAVLRGYGLRDDDEIHAVRIVRAAIHGFVALELDQGFRLPLSLDQSFERLIDVLDRGLAGPAAA